MPLRWPEPVAFEPAGAFAAAHPAALARMSGWTTHVTGPVDERPDVGHRGSLGTGNGTVFGFVGLADPVNTLHSLVGPTYERRDRFFGDYAIRLAPADAAVSPQFDEEWATRSLSSPALLTRGRLGALELDTIDFAPESELPAVRSCFIRVITVRNTGQSASEPCEIRVVPTNDVSSPRAGVLLETTDSRSLTTAFVGVAAESDGGDLRLPLDAIPAGGEQQAVLSHCTAEGTTDSIIPVLEAGALLDATTASYQAWESELVQLELPDRMVADFVDGMKLTLKTQTTVDGATCPMSQYTRTWARDNIGPTLALLSLGAHDDVRAMMDYIYAAVLLGSDLANSYDADLPIDDLPPAPDWDAMPALSGKVAAETPSYMVWMYGAHQLHSGRITRAEERFGFLRRCLLAQGFSPEGLLPFTGDETYRGAMNITFGLGIEFGHADKSWSANSSLLWLGAAHHFMRLAESLGRTADAEHARERYAEVEAGLLTHFRLADGCVSSHVDRTSGAAWPAPYEDVALKTTWAGWLEADAPLARDINGCHFARLRSGPGQLQSFLQEDASTSLLIEADAVFTGMLPGYALSALTDAGHAEASAAVNVLGASISTTGNLQEYNIILGGERSGLTIVYDAQGVIGDYTTKYRPWEGGIDAHALLHYLLGFRPDAPNRSLSLRPHLPEGWPAMGFRNLRIGEDRFDVNVSRTDGGHEVRVQSRAVDPYQVTLRWDAPIGSPAVVVMDGERLSDAELERFEHFGLQSVQTSPQSLPAGQAVVFEL